MRPGGSCFSAPDVSGTIAVWTHYLAEAMTVPVLLFASYADAFGTRCLDVPVEPPCAVTDLVAALRRLPGGETLPPRPLVAVNHAFADYRVRVNPGDEVALIPPVAGG